MLVVNFKTYKEATGKKALALAKICESIFLETGIEVVIGVQAVDIRLVSSQVKIPVFAQHIEAAEPGRNTGFTTAFAVKTAGAAGVFLNHSEHYCRNLAEIEKSLGLAKELDLKTLVFVKDLVQAKEVDKFSPGWLALEEPSMVSGDIAMVKVKKLRDLIKTFSSSVSSVPLVGAGVKTAEDVKQSLALGSKGVALASGFIKASDPEAVLMELAEAFK
jgi:triosephosphate isomerase (TIM)